MGRCPGNGAGAGAEFESKFCLRYSGHSGPRASHLPSLVMTVWLPNEEDGQEDFRGLRHLMEWVRGKDRGDRHS